MAYIDCQEDDSPLEHRVGVGCLGNLNQRMFLLKSPVGEIVEAIYDLYPFSVLNKDAYGLTVSVVEATFVVYQFHNHDWGIIEVLGFVSSSDQEGFFNSISKKLKVHGVLFEQSDTSIFIKYRFFSSENY